VRAGLAHKALLSSIESCFPFGRWTLMLEYWLGVFPFEISPYLAHRKLCCLVLICELIPHPKCQGIMPS
jgi:hypothetical protein